MFRRFVAMCMVLILIVPCVTAYASDVSYLETLSAYGIGDENQLMLKEEVRALLTDSQAEQVEYVMKMVKDMVGMYLTIPYLAGAIDSSDDVWSGTKERANELDANRETVAELTDSQRQQVTAVIDGAVLYANGLMNTQVWKSSSRRTEYLDGLLSYLDTYFVKNVNEDDEVQHWTNYVRSVEGEFVLNDEVAALLTTEQEGCMATLITVVADFMADASATSYKEAMQSNPAYLATLNDVIMNKLTKTTFISGLSTEEMEDLKNVINIIMNLSLWSMDAEWWEDSDNVATGMQILEVYLDTCCVKVAE